MELLKLDYPNLQALLCASGWQEWIKPVVCRKWVALRRFMMCGTAAEIKELEMHALSVFLALPPRFAKVPELVAGGRYFRRRRGATNCWCASWK